MEAKASLITLTQKLSQIQVIKRRTCIYGHIFKRVNLPELYSNPKMIKVENFFNISPQIRTLLDSEAV